MEALAEFTQSHMDGEAGIATKIYPKESETGARVSRVQALEASGMEEINDDRMGQVQANPPTISSAFGIWIVQQTWYANV